MSLLEVQIRKEFPDWTLDVDCILQPRTAFFGRSGAGKTTLIEIIAGIRPAGHARIILRGRILEDTTFRTFLQPEQRRIGYVPQDSALFPHLTVEQNIRFGRRPDTAKDSQFSPDHLVEYMGLSSLLERWPRSLSGGERQRVAFARALATAPELLLLDEPLSNLDAERRSATVDLLRRIQDDLGVPMIYVSHSRSEIHALASHVVVLDRGRIVQQGSPGEVLKTAV
jgi:molybdate transport system ATP-binding protein